VAASFKEGTQERGDVALVVDDEDRRLRAVAGGGVKLAT
jgi:hypothetical protein